MTTKEIMIHNYEAFGDLIKTWSKGLAIRPKTVAEFKKAIGIKNVTLVGYADTDPVTFLDLPPSSAGLSFMVPNEADLVKQPPPVYPLPDFYGDLAFGGAKAVVAPENREKFRSSRIGDYSAGKCM